MRQIAALLICLAGCRREPVVARAPEAPPYAGADKVTLLFSASAAGQLVPCGCSPDQRGGLPREVEAVKRIRTETRNVLYAEAGDLLFESAVRPPAQMRSQREAKARVLAKGQELLGSSARAVGLRDLALGPEFVAETAGHVPLLDAGGTPLSSARATVLDKAGPVPVGLFAAGLGEKPEETIAARAAELRKEGARLVVLFLHPRGDRAFAAAQTLLPAAKAAGVDLVVLGRRDDPASDPNHKDASMPPLLAVEGHGQSLLRVDVQLGKGPVVMAAAASDKQGELAAFDERIVRFRAQADAQPDRREQLLAKVKELEERRAAMAASVEKLPDGATVATATFVPLGPETGEDARAKALVDAYDAQVAEQNLAEAKTQPESCPTPEPGEAAFAGVQSCVECHQSAVEFWEQTNHAHAYSTLVGVKKQFSLDCIRCHVTGWQQPNGVCRIDRTDALGPGSNGHGLGRRDVQCEMCHGPASEHIKDPPEHIRAEVPATVCMRCHEAANSPHFDNSKYRPWITGPGHGEPLAKGEKPHPRGTQ